MAIKKKPVEDLASAIGENAAWTGALLQNLGIPVDRSGRYDPRRVSRLLERLVPAADPKPDLVNEEEKRQMGETAESCRQFLIDELKKHGIKVIHREEDQGFRFTAQLPNGKNLWVATYVALTRKSSHRGQVAFRVAPGRLGDAYDWYCCIAQPFGRIYVQSRKDMKDRWQKNHTGPMGRMTVTFSAGQTEDLLENRIKDLLSGRR